MHVCAATPFDTGCTGSDASCVRSSTFKRNKSKHAERQIERVRDVKKRCSTSPSTFNKFMLYTFCERGIHFSSLECFQFFRCSRDRTFSVALTNSTHTYVHAQHIHQTHGLKFIVVYEMNTGILLNAFQMHIIRFGMFDSYIIGWYVFASRCHSIFSSIGA